MKCLGEMVRLRSGGPLMIVEAKEKNLVKCVWFNLTGELHRASFLPWLVERQQTVTQITATNEDTVRDEAAFVMHEQHH